MEELLKKYENILKALNIPTDKKLTNNEGKIELLGNRWILMDVSAFPEYMIKSTANIMGEKIAKEFLYWFGYSYGEAITERYVKLGIPKEQIPDILASISTFFIGWGIPEFLELSFEKGKAVVKIINDFETESAIKNGSKPTNNFFKGAIAGMFAKLINAKTHATAEFKDGVTIITVVKR